LFRYVKCHWIIYERARRKQPRLTWLLRQDAEGCREELIGIASPVRVSIPRRHEHEAGVPTTRLSQQYEANSAVKSSCRVIFLTAEEARCFFREF
jgi:hypothetical protein